MRECVLALLAAFVVSVFVRGARADEVSRQFLWEQANTAMGAAARPEEFLDAARTYDRLVREGVRNGAIFFNLGTALLLAGEGAQAEVALLRAERYSGTTPDLLTNLRQARAIRRGQREAPLSWTRMVFFWHYGLAGRTRLYLAAAAWWLLWLGLLLKWPRAVSGARSRPVHPVAASMVLLGVFFTLVFGVSVAVTCLHEWQDGRTWPGVSDVAPEVQS